MPLLDDTRMLPDNTTHGMSETPEWLAHKNMRARCYTRKDIGYHRYGGRGIRVCDEWLGPGGFEQFYSDVGPRPSSDHSLGRIDNNKNYGPGNVRWETRIQQGRNQSTNRLITYRGVTKTATEWANDHGGSIQALVARLDKYGWSVEKALTVPFKRYKGRITYSGRTMSMAAWCREVGLPRETLRSRLRKGWPVDLALTIPFGGRRHPR